MKKLLLSLLLGVPMAEAGEQWVKDAAEGAPLHITGHASYLKWNGEKFVEEITGTNGFSCLTLEDKKGRFEPSCLNQAAVASVLPVYELQTRMLAAGKPIEEVHREIERRFKEGVLPVPAPRALVYMMSPRNKYYNYFNQTLSDIAPHVMLYMPAMEASALGLNGKEGLPGYYKEYPHMGVIHFHTPMPK